MPSASDVYITPASRRVDFYNSSSVVGYISGNTDMTYKSTGDFGIYAVGGDIRLTGSAGSQVAKLRMDGTTFYVSGAGEVFHQSANGTIILPPYGTSAGETTALYFRELAANGTAKIGIKSLML